MNSPQLVTLKRRLHLRMGEGWNLPPRKRAMSSWNNLKAAALYAQAIEQDPNNPALYRKNPSAGALTNFHTSLFRKNASAGALTNFEVLNFFQSRGASKEVAVTIAPSEYKVFEYLIGTAASHQTTESISVLMDKVKKYDLAKSEVLNIVNLRPTLPVGVYTIVENCDVRLGEEGAQELVDMVADVLPLPERRGEADLDNTAVDAQRVT